MGKRFACVLACALALAAGTGVANAQEPDSQTTTAVVEVTVWRSVANPDNLYVSTRPEGGSWRTEDTALDMSGRSRSGSFHQSNAVRVEVPLSGDETAVVDVTVWRSVANPANLYVSTRAEGGGWRTEDTALDMSALSRSRNYHQSNAVRVEVQLERESTDAQEADARGYIPALDATVVALEFVEWGPRPLPFAERLYRTTFDQITTRFILWQLELSHPAIREGINLSIDTTIYRSDGTTLTSFHSEGYFEEGWANSTPAGGTGSATGGFWQPGTYRAELSVAGKTIARGEFEVLDRSIPGSGPFTALREPLGWAHDPLSHDSRVALLALAGLHEADPTLARSVASFGWVREGPGGDDLRALQQLDLLAREHLGVARRVAAHKWLADGVSEDEWLGLRALAGVMARDETAGRALAGAVWLRDGITEHERAVLTELREFAVSTPFVAQISAFPWVRDNITEDERWMVWNLEGLADSEPELASLVLDLAWIQDDVTEYERWLVWNLLDLGASEPEFTSLIASFPWFQDDVTEHERWLVRNLNDLASVEPQLAGFVVDLPWFKDDITEHERQIVWNLKELATVDLPLASLVADLPWFRDDVTEHERRIVWNMKRLATVEPQLASLVADSPWFRDDVTEHERWIVWNLQDLAASKPELANLVAGFPWFQDDVTEHERRTVWNLKELAEVEPHLANLLVDFPWLQDDVTESERWTVSNLRMLAAAEPQLAGLVAGFAWFQDGVTESERWTVWSLKEISAAEPQFARLVASYPWVQDDVTDYERLAVQNLRHIVGAGVDAMVTAPYLEALSPAGAAATTALAYLALWAPEGLALVVEYPTVADGITEDETVVVSTLWGVHQTEPDLVETLLDPARAMLESRPITLPLAGEVTLTVIRTKPGMERTMDLVEAAVGAIEELMGSPLPSQQVTFLFADAVPTTFFGAHYGTHIALSPKVDSMSMSRDHAYRPIVHEVAHYYWTGNEPWVNEGVANLLTTVVDDTFKDLPERDAVFPCPYARRISDLESIGPQQRSRQFLCSYSLGERLFRDLYRKLGEDFWDGLRRLYQKSQAEDESDTCEGTRLGACHVEAAFKEGGSQEVLDIVDEVFDFWYEKREPTVEDSAP